MSDIDKVQGTWRIEEREVDGHAFPSGGGATFTVTEDSFVTHSMGAVYEGRLELNSLANPKEFDLLFTEGPEKGNRSLGIYEFIGEDWRICLTITGNTRAQVFATSAGSGLALELLKRGSVEEKDSNTHTQQAEMPCVGAPDATILGDWTMIRGSMDGEPLDERMVLSGVRRATPTEVTTHFGKQLFMQATYQTNPNAEPRTIDYVHVAGRAAGQSQLGIYKLEADTLTTCFGPPGGERPKDFDSVRGDKRLLTVWLSSAATMRR